MIHFEFFFFKRCKICILILFVVVVACGYSVVPVPFAGRTSFSIELPLPELTQFVRMYF